MVRRGSYSDALLRLVRALNEARVKYALTGAAAVGYYGIPRSSMDIDVVIEWDLSTARIDRLARALIRNGFATSRDEILRAVASQDVKIQAFDEKTGFLRADIFREKTFGQVEDRIDGLRVWFRTFEELVAKKIQYGDLDEVKLLFRRRGPNFQKNKIVRLLSASQKAKLEQILREVREQSGWCHQSAF